MIGADKYIGLFIDRMQIAFSAALAASPYRRAAEAIGFSFGQVSICPRNVNGYCYEAVIRFECICGRVEYGSFVFWIDDPIVDRVVDIDLAERLYRLGSFSKTHLLEDGYSEAFADNAERTFGAALQAARS